MDTEEQDKVIIIRQDGLKGGKFDMVDYKYKPLILKKAINFSPRIRPEVKNKNRKLTKIFV